MINHESHNTIISPWINNLVTHRFGLTINKYRPNILLIGIVTKAETYSTSKNQLIIHHWGKNSANKN